jgi:N-acetylglutamate synthase
MKHDVENIERATLAAVSPEAVLELSGWLLAFDTGTVGRAKSAVPMLHTVDMADASMLRRIEVSACPMCLALMPCAKHW